MTQLNKLNTYNLGTVCMNAMHCTMLNQRKYFHTHFKININTYYIKAPIKVFNCNKQNRLTSHRSTVAHQAF